MNLLNDAASWLVLAAIILVAVTESCWAAWCRPGSPGMSWNEAFALGALMNTRGLVELIALNIGYDLGILPPRIFSMMVLMALVTTFRTGPLLNLAIGLRTAGWAWRPQRVSPRRPLEIDRREARAGRPAANSKDSFRKTAIPVDRGPAVRRLRV